MNSEGECVLIPGLQPLPSDDSECWEGADYWYDRTAYRKIPYSTCEGGLELHHGDKHVCPGFKAHGAGFWWTIILLPFGITALVAYWYYRRSGLARGYVTICHVVSTHSLITPRWIARSACRATPAGVTAPTLAYSIRWRLCHGSCWAWLVLHGNMLLRL
jgi:hypothetical protein